jgi:hypothetical protein
VNHGIAVSWQDSDMDCREPLIVNDDQLTPDLAEKRHTYPTGTNAPFCAMTIFFCQMNLSKILTHVVQIAFGLKRTNYSKIMKLDEEAETFARDLMPKVLRPETPGYDHTLDILTLVIRCFYLKVILLLHRPFIGRSRENPQFKLSRDRAVEAAVTIVQNSIQIFGSRNVLLDNHFSASPMLAHGLFTAPIALALDLYTWPDQPNPEPSRQALLEIRRTYLQLSTTFSPIKRLYKILNCLMAKAWEKAGIPLPPEEKPSRMGSLSSSTSTPSPLVPNYDQYMKYGPQGVVPTSFQQFHSNDPYSNWTRAPNLMPTTAASVPWETADTTFPLFGSDTSSSQFSGTPQFPEMADMDNSNVAWVCHHTSLTQNQNEWDEFVNSMDLDPVVNGTSFL